jgi:glutathione S-transferase
LKLYFSPGACSLSPHIVLQELGMQYDTEKVNLADKKTASGGDYRQINPKGYVPALQLDNGEVLTEVSAVVQYLADQMPEKHLVPKAGTMERYRLMEWLNFISTEMHKAFSPLFKPTTPDETKKTALDTLTTRLEWLDKQLQGRDYLTGAQFTVADAYLFTVLTWTRHVKLDLARWPAVHAFFERVGARPAVQAAMVSEGLRKA